MRHFIVWFGKLGIETEAENAEEARANVEARILAPATGITETFTCEWCECDPCECEEM